MKSETEKAETLRRKVSAIIEKIDDRGSLLFLHWLLERIVNNGPLPPVPELKRLHRAFVRADTGFPDTSEEIVFADLRLLAKHLDTGEVKIGRPLGMAIKFYRAQKKMTRLELSKRCGMSLRTILSLERGRFGDISIPRFGLLADGLGIDPLEFMGKIMEFLKGSARTEK